MDHKLNSPWTMYFFQRPEDGKDYAQGIHKIGKFSTCEEFWSIFSHVISPDKLPIASALQMFREDNRAMWEDEQNRNGGSFLIRFSKGLIPYYWERLVLGLIGEQMSSDVVGVIASPRQKYDLIYLWNKTSNDPNLRLQICAEISRLLELPNRTRIEYSPFASNNTNSKSTVQYVIEASGPVERVFARSSSNNE